ncbi:MAG TPA: hypothetical protein VGZ92_02975 [Bradyrhizobium sp.]|nr:hypothetical protein [Bradyrhizobium sp.]
MSKDASGDRTVPIHVSATTDGIGPWSAPHVPQWRWTCNIYGKPGGGSGSGDDLEDCKVQFRSAWATIRAGLTEADIARAHEMRR